ncbi:ABC transporter substrate-binding protein [Pengzhenrongella sicca]|uniref:Extracellular solute-binding protein n=1 Tax=Pengzhenrongella sicca TaxID=2819238 RepID=A0A8A4ZF84_9MICO|nr:extracellular solute-binding protein [Pengzhenrongella sicca]QTE29157.1 extracellular solute-binding protein [Pengzhenrongella sicca]
MHLRTRGSRAVRPAVAAWIGLGALTLAACSGGGDPAADSTESGGEAAAGCTNTVVKPDAEQVTVWAWYPAFEPVVDLFNNSHDDIQICWSNAGQGNDEYTKFSTTIEAKSGAPDVIMLETEVLPSFIIRDALADLSPYGAADVEANYAPGVWADHSSGDSVYAIPVDGGPMGMLYRQDMFEAAGIMEPPATWEQFAIDAQKLRDSGSTALMTDFPTNGRAFNQALFAQAGSVPYVFGDSPTDVTIELNDDGTKKVLNYWFDLIDKGLVGTDDAFTTDYNTKLVDGSYAVYLAAAWGPGYLSGLAGADESAVWRAAPLPQWDAADPVQVNWGGSAFAVTSQAKNPEAAAVVAKEIFGTEEAWKIGIEQGALYPLWLPIAESDYFKGLEYPFFGGQKINEDVFLAAAAGYEGFTFSPFQNFAYDQLTEEQFAAVQGEKSPDQAADDLQDQVVEYATSEGFTVD